MKLRNKKTGEIIDLELGNYKNPTGEIVLVVNHEPKCRYHSLAELSEEWEDYEEPKGYWMITSLGEVVCPYDAGLVPKGSKEIGNYFSSREEAEKAVEKLKAFKRLKDKGFRFKGLERTYLDMDCIRFDIGSEYLRERDLRGSELNKDLDICFGGEE